MYGLTNGYGKIWAHIPVPMISATRAAPQMFTDVLDTYVPDPADIAVIHTHIAFTTPTNCKYILEV